MKHLRFVVAFVVLLLCFCISANAQEALNITYESVSVKNNRLFDLSVCAKSEKLLCGGEFSFAYDSDIVKFISVSSDAFETKAKAENDKVTVVFADANGVDLSDYTEVFTLKFKSIDTGSFDVYFENVSCFDESFSAMAVNSDDCTVTVRKNTVDVKCTSSKSKTKVVADKSSTTDELSQSAATADYMALSAKDNTIKSALYAVAIGVAVILLFFAGLLCGRIKPHKNKKADKENAD